MCGSLRHENRRIRIGQPVLTTNARTFTSGLIVWSGFLQKEKINTFWGKQTELVPVLIHAERFTEQMWDFRVPCGLFVGYGLKGNVYLRDKLIAKANTVRILTRAPGNKFEGAIHHRWPCCASEEGKFHPHVFTEADVLSGQRFLKGFGP